MKIIPFPDQSRENLEKTIADLQACISWMNTNMPVADQLALLWALDEPDFGEAIDSLTRARADGNGLAR